MAITTIPKQAVILIVAVLSVISFSTSNCLSGTSGPALTPLEYSRFVNQKVLWPIPDGIRLSIPTSIENTPLAALGFVDVTKPPFSADASGKSDATAAIQKAVNFARDHQMVTFFPSGKYLISDTIECIQNFYERTNKRVVGGRLYPCILVGSTLGARPEIFIKARSKGFTAADHPKYLIHFWARRLEAPYRSRPNISMNQVIKGINITVGNGNNGAIAIRHLGAQGSTIQDCTINMADGLSGIEGGLGSGGSITAVTVIGGKVGLDLRKSQPAATICGITLINQRETALLYGGNQALSAVGLKIISRGTGPVIKTFASNRPSSGQLCLADSTISFKGRGEIAIEIARSLYLNNVYFKNTSTAVLATDGHKLIANTDGWFHVREYAKGVRPEKWKGYQYEAPLYTDGNRKFSSLIVTAKDQPPAKLQTQHLWADNFVSWQNKQTANVKEKPYNAAGDGYTDDTIALQNAIDNNKVIFLPKGYYKISRSLRLKDNSVIIGAARHLSIIMARPPKAGTKEHKPWPLIITSPSAKAKNIISQCGLYVPWDIPGLYALKWQCGSASILRDTNFITQPMVGYKRAKGENHMSLPLVWVTGNGAGKWYNFYQDSLINNSLYRHLLISDTKGPLTIYQCNPEHTKGGPNMEITSAKNITIYGLKGEGNQPVLNITDSNNINIFGYGGNAAAPPGKALFNIVNSHNIRLANIVDAPKLANRQTSLGRGMNPKTWTIISENNATQKTDTTPLDRPVLYLRE